MDGEKCKLCGESKQPFQEFCGAACSARWEAGERPSPLAAMTAEQKLLREDAVKAIGQRANALIRYDGVDPAIVAAALQWCATSMYAQAAADLTRETYLEACGATWDEAKEFLAALARKEDEKTT